MNYVVELLRALFLSRFSLSPVQITLICLIKSLKSLSPEDFFMWYKKNVSKVAFNVISIMHHKPLRDQRRTSLTNAPRNVFILSWNKTYIKYCCRLRRRRRWSVWNITKLVLSREFQFLNYECNVGNYMQRESYRKIKSSSRIKSKNCLLSSAHEWS